MLSYLDIDTFHPDMVRCGRHVLKYCQVVTNRWKQYTFLDKHIARFANFVVVSIRRKFQSNVLMLVLKEEEEESESEAEVEAPNKNQAEEMNLEHPPKKKKSLAQAE